MAKRSLIVLALGWLMITAGVLIVLTVGPCALSGLHMTLSPQSSEMMRASDEKGWGELVLMVTALPLLAGVGAVVIGGLLLNTQRRKGGDAR